MSNQASSAAKQVVCNTSRVDNYAKFEQVVGKKLTLIFALNSSNSSEAAFFDKCNEYLKEVDSKELGVLWCDYTALSSKFEPPQEDSELRLCAVGLYMDTKYISVKSAAGFVTAVKEAIESDHKAKPKHVLYGADSYSWPRCMCCCGSHDEVISTRKKRIDSVASLLGLKPSTCSAAPSHKEERDLSGHGTSDDDSAQETKEICSLGEKERTVDTPP